MDPVGFVEEQPATFNSYSYAANNPYLYTDPDGKFIMIIPLLWELGGAYAVHFGFFAASSLAAYYGIESMLNYSANTPSVSYSGGDTTYTYSGSSTSLNNIDTMFDDAPYSEKKNVAEGSDKNKTLRPDIELSGGRSGSKVKGLQGPPNSIVKGSNGRVFETNSKGEVINDITRDRVKPVIPGRGFGQKRPPSQKELDWVDKIY